MSKIFFSFVLFAFTQFTFAAENNFSIPLRQRSGVYEVMATLNSELKVYFVVDSGAADVTISESVAELLAKNESLTRTDIKGDAQYEIADGNKATGKIVNIKSMDIGGHTLYNVKAVVLKGVSVPLLLGQSALKQLVSWSINSKLSILEFKSSSTPTIESKSFEIGQKQKDFFVTNQLLCKGEITKQVDSRPASVASISVDLQIDVIAELVKTTDYWGCLAIVGLTGSNEKLVNSGCVGELPVAISESEINYYRTNKGELYSGTGSFTINRSSGLMSISSVAFANQKANANWVMYMIDGKLQCKKIERQF